MRCSVALFLICSVLFSAGLPVRAEDEKDFKINLLSVSEPFMLSPHDMTLTPDGMYLVITDMGNDRILLLDPLKLTLQAIIGEDELSVPHDVAFDGQGRLLVADSGNDRIVMYRLEGTKAILIDTWDGIDGPEGITSAPDGRVFIAATLEHHILSMKNGKIEKAVGRAWGKDLDRPHDVEIQPTDKGYNVITSDPGNNRLVVFDQDFAPQYEISTWDPPFSEPKYFSRDEEDRLYIADQYNHVVRVFDKDATPLISFADRHVKLPEGVLAKGNRVWVSDSDGGRVLLYELAEKQ